MPLYNCECCNYSTKIKSHFNRHLLTKKHKNNLEKIKKQKKEKNNLSNIKKRTCEFCGKIMSTPYSLKRHIEKSCKKVKKYNSEILNKKNIIKENTEENNIQNTSLNENNIQQFMANNDFMKNSFQNINGDTVTTNITINGVLLDEDKLHTPELKYTLINAFSHPFFKTNLKYIPQNLLEDSEFMYFFKMNHKLHENSTMDNTNNQELLDNLENNIVMDENETNVDF